ncbi:slipin family protein [Myxococcus qinghaiensis]|uniref:slipin family protein n=1 Tax=Myxococcus qinghaiensis TaxID=2906758 RepID=UPI0020A80987|nr:slipin family protein [Myxococcus qinghaiensis]MCP3166136.1 slipin family protein [Myxococcus qinghaiensis]
MDIEQLKQMKELAQAGMDARRKKTGQPGSGSEHVSLGKPLRAVIFVVTWAVFTGLGALVGGLVAGPLGAGVVLPVAMGIALLPAWWASRICRVAAQWERAVILRLGKFHSIKGPGVLFVFPVFDNAWFVDTRLLTLDIPHQQVITRDNVPVAVDGVIFFLVKDTERAVVTVQDYRYAIGQYAQAALRDVIGSMTLDELLSERDQIQSRIAQAVEERSVAWGIHVDSIRLLDINMPEDLKRMMSRQASAEREKRATITKAEGDKEAAINLAAAATTMARSPGAMQLRTLQSLDGLGTSPSNTVVFAVPTDVLELVRGLAHRTLHGTPAEPPEP